MYKFIASTPLRSYIIAKIKQQNLDRHISENMASSNENTNTLQAQESNLYEQWMNLQETELSDLLQALELKSQGRITDFELTQLIQRTTNNFELYIDTRCHLASQDPSPFFSPPWCTTLENSTLWLAGCRPSSFIRLIYALCGMEIETQLMEYLQNVHRGDLGDLSHAQLCQVDKLQMKIIKEETRLSSKLASLQEDMADQPMAGVIKKPKNGCCGSDQDVQTALDENGEAMEKLMEQADKLRLETYKELMDILTPLQGVMFIAASKKLRICMKQWGEKRDNDQGRCEMMGG